MRVAETAPHVQARVDLLVQGEFRTLVPGQRVAQEPGRVPHLADDGLLDLACVVPVGRVRQDREPGGAFDQGAGGAPVRRTGDWITLPMAGDGPVLDLGGSVRDHDHGIPEPGSAPRAAAGFALGAALAHGPFQLGFQLALALDVDGLVDRLDACVHVLIIGEVMPEPIADLLGTPMPSKAGEYLPPQARARPGFPGLGAFEPVGARLLGVVRLVASGQGVRVASYLAAHGGRSAIRMRSSRPCRCVSTPRPHGRPG